VLRRRTIVVCPTARVAAAFSALYPGSRVEIAPFAAAEPGDYLSEVERAEARRVMGIGAGACSVAMLGTWWPRKDNDTVLAALSRIQHPVVLLCGGTPIDSDALRALARHDHVDVRLMGERLTDVEVCRIYAASSLTVVSRRRGVGTESGLVMDAARYGVPLICSDHDPDLLRRLAGSNWVRTFVAGDPVNLAAVLAEAAIRPPARPDRGAARAMGLRDGAGLLSLYDALADRLQA
jgi:glycosyltransferase involved in cell wall biosynthesis